jgi:hypothetical protein
VASEIPFGSIALWGAKQLAGTLFGWWTTSEADTAKQIAQDNGRRLNRVIEATSLIARRLSTSEEAIKKIIQAGVSLSQKLDLLNALEHAGRAADQLEVRWNEFEEIVTTAADSRLSMHAVKERDLFTLKKVVIEATVLRGLRTPVNSALDFLQCPTTFLMADKGIDLVVHIPAAPIGSLLQIFRYVILPLPLEGGMVATPRLVNTILAIEEGNEAFTIMTDADLLQCRQLGSLYFCPHLNVVRRSPPADTVESEIDEGLCLFFLFTHNVPAALRVCPLTLSTRPDQVRQIARGDFLAISSHDEEATIDCTLQQQGAPRGEVRLFAGTQTNITLPPGCQAIPSRHKFANPINGRSETWEATRTFPIPNLDLPPALQNDTIEELQQFAEQFLGQRDDVTLEEALQAQYQHQADEDISSNRFLLWVVGGLAAISLLAILVGLVGLAWSKLGNACHTRRAKAGTDVEQAGRPQTHIQAAQSFQSLRGELAATQKSLDAINCASAPPYY